MSKTSKKTSKLWSTFVQLFNDELGNLDNVKIKENGESISILKTNAVSIIARYPSFSFGLVPTICVDASFKQKTGGYTKPDDDGVSTNCILHLTEVKRVIADIKKCLLKAQVVETDPKEQKQVKFRPVAELDTVDLIAEFLKPLIINKFKAYIYASKKDTTNPDSKVQVRCDFWFNHDLHPQQYIVPDGKKLPQNLIDHPRRYHTRVEVDLDTKELTTTEHDITGTKITGITNIDDIINRICKSISGLKSNEENA